MIIPKKLLFEGVQILRPILESNGFIFRFGGEGRGSGGEFAWGEFIQGDRRLEFHFRNSLGLVRYYINDDSVSHESYMRELGVWDKCHYPGFSDDPLNGFRGLVHDLSFLEDFLSGSAVILKKAAKKEAKIDSDRSMDLMAGYVGDKRKLEKLRTCFRKKFYSEVIEIANDLKYPEQMTQTERKMIEIAIKRRDS